MVFAFFHYYGYDDDGSVVVVDANWTNYDVDLNCYDVDTDEDRLVSLCGYCDCCEVVDD